MVLGVAPIHRKKRDRKIIKAAQRREAVQGLVIETGRTEEEEAEEEEEEEQEDLLLATSGVKNGPFPLQILGGLLLRLFLPSPSHIQTTYFNITSNIIRERRKLCRKRCGLATCDSNYIFPPFSAKVR